MTKKKTYPLKDFPEDVRNFLIDERAKHQKKCDCPKFSLEKTIYKILRYVRDKKIEVQ
jgi:hypothetical protein